MKSYLDTNTIIAKDEKILFFARMFNLVHSDNISANKYEELLKSLNEETEHGQLVLTKVFNDKPARLIQWVKSEDTILFEIFNSVDNKDWKFSHEYTLMYEQLREFVPVYEYSLNIVNEMKKEQANKELAETSFLTRD